MVGFPGAEGLAVAHGPPAAAEIQVFVILRHLEFGMTAFDICHADMNMWYGFIGLRGYIKQEQKSKKVHPD